MWKGRLSSGGDYTPESGERKRNVALSAIEMRVP